MQDLYKMCKDVDTALMLWLYDNYNEDEFFSINYYVKNTCAKDIKRSPKSLDNALRRLVQQGFLIRLSRSIYRVNPEYLR